MTFHTPSLDQYYHIKHWGDGYFAMNEQGEIIVRKYPDDTSVTLLAIVQEAELSGLSLPLLIRFNDILHDRVTKIYSAFDQARQTLAYRGQYQLVYPIKVNQEWAVVKELLNSQTHTLGLEAGSKPELLAVIGMLSQKKSVIICNGYKDSTYIRAALIAQKMGHTVFIVIEKIAEWDIIEQESNRLGIRPQIGVRIRLVSKGAGLWEDTGGEKSKFGLSAAQVLLLVSRMTHSGMLDCLQMMHCHMGSEIANIQDIGDCMQEISQYYIALHQLAVPIHTLDVGGGLSVDYEGTQSATGCSMNYSLYEYASSIMSNIQRACASAQLPEPNIITESGRALTAHHAVLITNITGVEHGCEEILDPFIQDPSVPVVLEMWQNYQSLPTCMPSEVYASSSQLLITAQNNFLHGDISLQDKATVECLFKKICLDIQNNLDMTHPVDQALSEQLSERLAAKVFCNLSFFQSLPDAWALSQVFPVVPISQLLNRPLMHSILADLTCDSDGTLNHYVGGGNVNSTLLLPELDKTAPYMLGFFLVGAYQEILGNLHNLFGDTNSVAVTLQGNGQFSLYNMCDGDTVSNVLSAAHFDCKALLLSYKQQLKRTELPDDTIQLYLMELSSIFSQSTYLRV